MSDDLEPGTGGGLFHDERGSLSAARVLLSCWLGQSVLYVFVCVGLDMAMSNAVLSMDAGIATALITWAAGPRIAQYIGGQVGSVASAVGSSLRDAIYKRRDHDQGTEPTP